MKNYKGTWVGLLITVGICFSFHSADAANVKAVAKKNGHSKLAIRQDAVTGKVIVSWKGHGVLKKAARLEDEFKAVYRGAGEYAFEPTEEVAVFKLDAGKDRENGPYDQTNVYSLNVVGYVVVVMPPGLSLVANQLYYTNLTIGSLLNWYTSPPDGGQVFKYSVGGTYEVSTYDGVSRTWSNPNLDLNVGTGFFFNNVSSVPYTNTFVGEVLQGVLVNPLPAGLSTKAGMVPQASSINDTNGNIIPGMAGDEIRTYVNDGQGGGYYNLSVYNGTSQRWEPDLFLRVAEGFWISKQQPQNWVRVFYVQ